MATQHPNVAALPSQQQDSLRFQKLEHYAWDSDPEFQSGLRAILGTNPSAEQAEHLTLRARCFYLARKDNTPIDFNAYQHWRSQQPSSRANNIPSISSASKPSSAGNSPHKPILTSHNPIETVLEVSEATAPYPVSFSQVVELITSGRTIPGIRDVADTVLEGQASQTMTAKRKKPWEKDDAGAEEFVGADTSVANIA